jgi:peptide/nickel transport system permease protein
VQVTLSLSTAILVEASLSFLGLGTQPPIPSLGLMLSDSRDYMLLSPWTSVFSGLGDPARLVRLQPLR